MLHTNIIFTPCTYILCWKIICIHNKMYVRNIYAKQWLGKTLVNSK